ncbi:gamma-glutamylcyclotransferase family protein [Planotetraspora sp. GP83]|uniref:gamma-glutamylcyclotransferase family protein n=1 Tax=Planotetraspora sp. GP83 TaxID=3156264 RepID=UPI003517166D
MNLLFSYGTLQLEQVQLSQFGRLLTGRPDALPGYTMTMIRITDPEVIEASGANMHPLVVASRDGVVEGTVFEVTDAELAAADAYEVDDYARAEVSLRSGVRAYVYLSRDEVTEGR